MKIIAMIFLSFLLFSCDSTPEINDSYLDGDVIFDPSLYEPEKFLVSLAKPNPNDEEKRLPVIIAVHGYTATTFEWQEFRDYVDSNNKKILVSQVLLGGHGRTYNDFKNSTWKDWQTPIKEEYERLVAAGYKNISFAASSTGCPLILDLINQNYFENKVKPFQIFFIDPIIIASNKMLSLVAVLGPILGYVESGNTKAEDQYWYHYRPQETLNELQNLINEVRHQLEDGIALPNYSKLTIFKSKQDKVADPISAVMIYNGLQTNSTNSKYVLILDSDLHVVTRLKTREKITTKDINTQKSVFDYMIGFLE